MAKSDGRINLDRIAKEAEEKRLREARSKMTYEHQQAFPRPKCHGNNQCMLPAFLLIAFSFHPSHFSYKSS